MVSLSGKLFADGAAQIFDIVMIHQLPGLACIAKDALGDGVPNADLIVTGDHGMVLDGLVINASALVNETSITWVQPAELSDQIVYYHVETEQHDVILANGAEAETFLDVAERAKFDNYAEYLDLYGVDRIIPEMKLPRISTARLVPAHLKTRLGLDDSGAKLTA